MRMGALQRAAPHVGHPGMEGDEVPWSNALVPPFRSHWPQEGGGLGTLWAGGPGSL